MSEYYKKWIKDQEEAVARAKIEMAEKAKADAEKAEAELKAR